MKRALFSALLLVLLPAAGFAQPGIQSYLDPIKAIFFNFDPIGWYPEAAPQLGDLARCGLRGPVQVVCHHQRVDTAMPDGGEIIYSGSNFWAEAESIDTLWFSPKGELQAIVLPARESSLWPGVTMPQEGYAAKSADGRRDYLYFIFAAENVNRTAPQRQLTHLKYNYDSDGRLSGISYRVFYEENGRFEEYAPFSQPEWMTFRYEGGVLRSATRDDATLMYNAQGLVSSLAWRDAYKGEYTYDAQGRPLTLTHQRVEPGMDEDEYIKTRFTFTYNEQGDPAKVTDETWSCNSAWKPLTAAPSKTVYTFTYEYDEAGNWTRAEGRIARGAEAPRLVITNTRELHYYPAGE